MSILSLDAVRKKILDNLKLYNNIKIAYGSAIEQRISVDDSWLENSLIREIYLNEDWPREHDAYLNTINSYGFPISKFSNRINGRDDFDFKVFDWMAVVHGIYTFQQLGHKPVTFLDEMNQQRADLVINSGVGERYAEVKNLNEDDSFLLCLRDKIYAQSILDPESFMRVFDIEVSAYSVVKFDDFDKEKFERFWTGFYSQVKSNLESFTITYNDIEVAVKTDNPGKCAIIFHSISDFVEDLRVDEAREFIYFGKTYYKLLQKIYDAYRQLLSTRGGNKDLVRNDFIYVYLRIDGKKVVHYNEKFRFKIKLLRCILELDEVVNIITNYDN